MQEATNFTMVGLGMGLAGGLALFLFGMERMSDSLKAIAGSRMKAVLERLTRHRALGVLTGALTTAVLQSSSVTTVLVVGFITAGLMSMSQSVAVIMGANVGTTVTAQIIAFKVTHYALLLIAVGFGLGTLGRTEITRRYGNALLGLGLIFFGMQVMGDTMAPLRTYPPFLEAMTRMENPLLGIATAAAFTALVQSSSATTGIIIVMGSQGLLTLEASIALVFGANIGTCITALLAIIGRPREAHRAAAVHVLFNVLGVVIWLPFIGDLTAMVRWLSPTTDDLAADIPRQIANAHTIFNVANTALLLPFAGQFARLVTRLVPDRPLAVEDRVRARYLDRELLIAPSLALDRARLEIVDMGDRVLRMLERALPVALDGQPDEFRKLAAMDDPVDALHGDIVTYLGEISRTELGEVQTEELMRMFEAANDLENIGDILETNLVALAEARFDSGLRVSPATRDLLTDFHALVMGSVEEAILAVTQKNPRAARAVMKRKKKVNRLEATAVSHQAQRLVADEPNRLDAYAFETDLLQALKRVYYFAKRMARAAVPAELSDEVH